MAAVKIEAWHVIAVVVLVGVGIYLFTKTHAKGTVTVDENDITVTLSPGEKVGAGKGNFVAPGARDGNGTLGKEFTTVPGARADTVGYGTEYA